jgi:hypothetical protein
VRTEPTPATGLKRRWPAVAIMLGAALAIAGCAGSDSPSASASSSSSGYTLIKAAHPKCEAQGAALAAYLTTGQPAAEDLPHGGQRQKALSLSGAQRSVYISQAGDKVIEACEQQVTAQQQQRRAAAALARADAAARRLVKANLAADALAQPACQRVGGTWVPPGPTHAPENARCSGVPYLGPDGRTHHVTLGFDTTGAITPPRGAATATKSQCASGPGRWDAQLRLCLS